jgi:hypothetical protein
MVTTIEGTDRVVQMHATARDKIGTQIIVVGEQEKFSPDSRLFVYDHDGYRFVDKGDVYRYAEAEDPLGYKHEVLSAGLHRQLLCMSHTELDEPMGWYYNKRLVDSFPEGRYTFVLMDDGTIMRYAHGR